MAGADMGVVAWGVGGRRACLILPLHTTEPTACRRDAWRVLPHATTCPSMPYPHPAHRAGQHYHPTGRTIADSRDKATHGSGNNEQRGSMAWLVRAQIAPRDNRAVAPTTTHSPWVQCPAFRPLDPCHTGHTCHTLEKALY